MGAFEQYDFEVPSIFQHTCIPRRSKNIVGDGFGMLKISIQFGGGNKLQNSIIIYIYIYSSLCVLRISNPIGEIL